MDYTIRFEQDGRAILENSGSGFTLIPEDAVVFTPRDFVSGGKRIMDRYATGQIREESIQLFLEEYNSLVEQQRQNPDEQSIATQVEIAKLRLEHSVHAASATPGVEGIGQDVLDAQSYEIAWDELDAIIDDVGLSPDEELAVKRDVINYLNEHNKTLTYLRP